jgi:predicted phosphodiesterase
MTTRRLFSVLILLPILSHVLAPTALAQTSAPGSAAKAEATSTWVELGENGAIVARQAIPATSGPTPTCPAIQISGAPNPPTMMQQRGSPSANFPAVVCEAVIPNGATSAMIGSISLPLPKATIDKIVVIGDTGCKGDTTGTGMKVTPLEEPDEEAEEADEAPSAKAKSKLQDCTSHSDWPFSTVAKNAAALKPDLIVHVGDYVYVKEQSWLQWYTQFLKPAHDLLLAAPWIFVRGNHEDCERQGQGFFYLLDPRATTTCANDNTSPYLVKAGGAQFVVMDSSGANCDFAPGQPEGCSKKDYDAEVATWTGLFSQAKTLITSGEAMLLTHRPVWAVKPPKSKNALPKDYCQSDTAGRVLIAINSTMQASYRAADMKGIDLVLSGHIHNFQIATYQKQKSGSDPLPQLVVGDSGTELATPPPSTLKNCKLKAESGHLDLSTFQGMHEFGFGVLKSDGSSFDLYLKKGDKALKCSIQRHEAKCGT